MPWSEGDVEKHIKGLSDKAKKIWVEVANSALLRCQEKGGSDCEASAIRQANSVAKKQMEDDEKSYHYLTDISDIMLEEKDNKKTSWVEIFRIGKWNHPKWGKIEGTKKLFNDFITNWKNNILGRDIALDKTHDPSEGAAGWVKDMKIDGDRLKAKVEWTPWGVELIEQKGFKYFSPEYRDSYTDKESGKVYNNVLFGGGITNRPFLTNLSPIVLSEDLENQCFQSFEEIDMKEELWIALQEYVDKDTKKIETIMSTIKKYINEATDQMEDEKNKGIIESIVRSHMDSMMHEIMNNMTFIKNSPAPYSSKKG